MTLRLIICLSFLILSTPVTFAAEEEERTIKAPNRVSIVKGRVVITLAPEDQKKMGIVTARARAATHAEQIRAQGTVLHPQALNELKNGYMAALAQSEAARVKEAVSRREFDRLKALNVDNKNISDKAVQAAEADWQANAITARAAMDRVSLVESAASQQWGTVITRWLVSDMPEMERVLNRKTLLLQLTLPRGTVITRVPQTVSVEAEKAKTVTATIISPSPRTDPRIQGMSFFYLVKGPSILLPGMNVTAAMPAGPPVSGVLLPSPAVVWSGGKAWVFVRISPDQFVQKHLSAAYAMGNFHFTASGFSPGDEVVVTGAQLLLSERFRSEIKGEGD